MKNFQSNSENYSNERTWTRSSLHFWKSILALLAISSRCSRVTLQWRTQLLTTTWPYNRYRKRIFIFSEYPLREIQIDRSAILLDWGPRPGFLDGLHCRFDSLRERGELQHHKILLFLDLSYLERSWIVHMFSQLQYLSRRTFIESKEENHLKHREVLTSQSWTSLPSKLTGILSMLSGTGMQTLSGRYPKLSPS